MISKIGNIWSSFILTGREARLNDLDYEMLMVSNLLNFILVGMSQFSCIRDSGFLVCDPEISHELRTFADVLQKAPVEPAAEFFYSN